MTEQLKEEAIRLTKDILDLPPDEYKPSQRAIMIVERLLALLSPKGGKPPGLSDDWDNNLYRNVVHVLAECENMIPGGQAERVIKVIKAIYEPLIQQAKESVAEDIGGLLCCLAGNLMLEDKEAGTLLAKQLQPLIDTIKLRYLPHLPRKSPNT